MAQTIADLLNSVEADTVKTASAQTQNAAMDEIEKLAQACGLTEEINTPSASPEGQTKEASMSMHELLVQMNPESASLLGGDQEKTAELEKEAAAIEGAMGEHAQEICAEYLDSHIEKIASELVEAHGDTSTPHPQEVATNEDKSGKKIDTTPQIELDAMKPGKEGEVGHQQMKAAALRKVALLSQLED